MTSQEPDAEQRFRVTVQNRHVEFHENESAARARAAELEKAGLKDAECLFSRRCWGCSRSW
jgi:hypothetical protein